MDDEFVRLAHGNGGRFMRELIADIFETNFRNPELDVSADAARLDGDLGGAYMAADGFTVQPLEFPGGDIGSLAVNGTVNDLAVAGAVPRYLTFSAIIEEGLEIAQLRRIARSAGMAARSSDVRIVAGDTKVVPRGHGGGLYVTTTGLGHGVFRTPPVLSSIRAGDAIVASGTLGDHGAAVMLAREAFGLEGQLASDCASVLALTRAVSTMDGIRFMRDPTRGGIATVANEIALATSLGVRLREADVPVRAGVRSFCEILGFDPYYLASEGRVVAVVASEAAEHVLAAWRGLVEGRDAAIIGEIVEGPVRVVLETCAGGQRLLDDLEDDPLPRIC